MHGVFYCGIGMTLVVGVADAPAEARQRRLQEKEGRWLKSIGGSVKGGWVCTCRRFRIDRGLIPGRG
jgi:hypothetical protein